MENDSPQTLDLEVMPVHQLAKAEIDVQIATAKANPRSMTLFYKRAEAMITMDKETAETCMYRLRRRDPDSPGGFKIIEGESVRFAEIVAACYGNMRTAAQIVQRSPTYTTVRAVSHDLESNNLMAVEKIARTTYRDGTPYNDDMAITATNAAVSKAIRDAIFRVVPKALVKGLREKAKQVAFGDGKVFAERRQKAVDWATKTKGVPLERVLATLEVKGIDDMGIDHLEILTGYKTAILEGDMKIEEAFPPLEEVKSGAPVLEHPDVTKARLEKEQKEAQEKAKKEVLEASAKAASKAKAKEKPADKPAEKAPEANPEPPPQNVVEMPKQPETAPTPAPTTPEPAPAADTTEADLQAALQQSEGGDTPQPSGLSHFQALLKGEIEGRGHSFADFVEWGRASVFKLKAPTDWDKIDEPKAEFFFKSVRGIDAAIKKWKEGKK